MAADANSIHGGQAETAGYPAPCVADSCRVVLDRRLLIEEDYVVIDDMVNAAKVMALSAAALLYGTA